MRETYIDRMIVHSVFEEMIRTKYASPGTIRRRKAGNLSPAMGMRLRTKDAKYKNLTSALLLDR